MKPFQKIVEASEGSFDDSAHRVGDDEAAGRGLFPMDSFDGHRLDTESVEQAVVPARHTGRLFQSHADESI